MAFTGSYNAMSHTLLDTLTWRTLGSKINSWRKKTLHLVRMRDMRQRRPCCILNVRKFLFVGSPTAAHVAGPRRPLADDLRVQPHPGRCLHVRIDGPPRRRCS